MGLGFALDALCATGWSDLDSTGCSHDTDGRAYPTIERVRREAEEMNCTLTIRHMDAFDCYRAEWRDGAGHPMGAVVGATDSEAAVFALAHLRRRFAMQQA